MAEKNPYPPGSYRAKAWERMQREKADKNKPDAPKAPKTQSEGDSTGERLRNRRKVIDEAVEEATEARVQKMRSRQFSDDTNYG